MATKPGRKIAASRPIGRLRPHFDRLEARRELAALAVGSTIGTLLTNLPITTITQSPTLSTVSTSPSNLSVLTSTPSDITVTFNKPISAFSLGNQDFELLHLESDGSTQPLSPVEAQIGESLDPADPTGRRVVLTISKPLVQGSYQLLLNPSNQLMGVDGSSVTSTSSGLILSNFTISPPISVMASAPDLSTVGPLETVVPGYLNLSSNPGAVQYYKFEVAPGHHWLVGLEISAHRDGGTLDSALSLFDSQGHLIGTANQGLESDPGDPYLFEGLDPGTYYVGISDKKNIPSASGTYSPGDSDVGSQPTGGAFRIHLVADPADGPTQVLGIEVNNADPLSTNPTGLTIQFSGALALGNLESSTNPPLTLIDQNGMSWSVTPLSYDSSQGQLSIVFDQPLPAGTYTLELDGTGSLTDLSGYAPVAQGRPSGVLGSFVVSPASPIAGDLGALLPSLASSGVNSTVDVEANKTTTEQFAVVVPGLYAIEGVPQSSGVSVSILDASGKNLASNSSNSQGEIDEVLKAGVYKIVFTASSQPAELSFSIRQKQTQLSSFLEGGVGQGPALNLRLVTPQANFGQITSSTTQTTVSLSSSTTSGTSGNSSSNSNPGQSVVSTPTLNFGVATPFGPSVSGLLNGNGLVGRPSSQSSQISVVGTSGTTGLAAIASNSEGLPSGIIMVPVAINEAGQALPEIEVIAPANVAGLDRPASGRSDVTLEAGLLARSPESRRADDQSLADADWMGRFVSNSLDWIGRISVAGEDLKDSPETIIPETVMTAEMSPLEETYIESASMTSPFAIGIALGAIVFGYRRKILERMAVRRKIVPKSHFKPVRVGPHRRPRTRVY